MRILVLSFLLLASRPVVGQVTSTTEDVLDRLADELLATAEADVSYDELYEALTHLLSNPVDLNTVTQEQLRATMMLTEREINAFLKYRVERGPFLDVLEIQAIPEWTPQTVRNLAPFVRVRDPATRIDKNLVRRIRSESNSYLVMRLERTMESKRGYSNASTEAQRYAGNPNKYYLRYRTSRPGDFSVGIMAEQDPGELFDWNPPHQLGFDYLSGHIQLMNKGRIENLVMGDYQAQFGQGLQLGSVFGLGKTAQTITGIRRSNLGFLPYMSASESYYMRGVAATLRLTRSIRLHLFGSSKNRDANTESDEPMVSALQNSGLHRTVNERQAKGQIVDQDIGGILQYRKGHLDIGVMSTVKHFSRIISPGPTPYNQFVLRGDGYSNLGAYINASWSNLTLFHEVAHTMGYGTAVTAGLLGNLSTRMEMSWLFRSFDRDFYSAYSNAVAENSAPANEQGLYWGFRSSLPRKFAVSGYLDVFRFPWLKYRVYKPSEGSEWLLRADYTPSKTLSFFVQVREEVKERNSSLEGTLYRVLPGIRRQAWLSGEFNLSPSLTLKSRIQGSRFEFDGVTTSGIAVIQDVSWKIGKFSFSARYALFDTEDYDNRQYVYERDVWMATSLPAYDGIGIRNFVLLHFAASRHLDFWVRWSRTWYADRETIGSGGEQIAGNARNDVKFQLRIRP